jgi:hypothetical protein
VGQDIDAALQGHFDPFVVGRMGEDRFTGAMGFGDDGGCGVQRHNQDAVWLDRPGKNLDAVGAIVNLQADAFGGLRR